MDSQILLTMLMFYKNRIKQNKNHLIKRLVINPRFGTLYCTLDHYPKEIRAILNGDNRATKKHLRVTAKVFQRMVMLLPKKHHGWSGEMELLILLIWMAAGTSYRIVALLLNMSISTVHEIVTKLLTFISKVLIPKIIHFPTSMEEINAIGRKFCRRAGTHVFNKAAGAIDGTHVTIKCPVHLHSQYINRKLKYSIQTQAICDANHKFLDIFVGYPGSVHDTRVLYNSPIYQNRLYPPEGYYLLGDSGYPCRISPMPIVTPFKETRTLSDREKTFNFRHSKARNVIECGFGQMKTRWRNIFNRDLELKIENSVKTIVACCVLHNVCVDMNDFVPYEPSEQECNIESIARDELDGTEFRQHLLNTM